MTNYGIKIKHIRSDNGTEFKNNGLDIEISAFGGDARVQQAMAADAIDIGLGSGPGVRS